MLTPELEDRLSRLEEHVNCENNDLQETVSALLALAAENAHSFARFVLIEEAHTATL